MSGRLHGPAAWLLLSVTAAMMIFILAPLLVTVAISISDTPYIVFPPRGFTVEWYGKVLQDADFLSALWFSTVLAVARHAGRAAARRPGRVRAGPLGVSWPRRERPRCCCRRWCFPVLITGVALLQLFSTIGFDNTPLNMLIGHVLVTVPYVVRTVDGQPAAGRHERSKMRRARWGPARWRVFRRITVPQIAPGLAAGALFAFMISFDNFPISLWLADAQHDPMPLLIFEMIASVFEPSVAAISTLMILLAMVVVLILERIGGLQPRDGDVALALFTQGAVNETDG